MTRLTRSSLIISCLLILGSQTAAAEDAAETACDCSCQRYTILVSESLPQSPIQEDDLLSCAGACAMAWARCEAQSSLADVSTDDPNDPSLGQNLAAQVNPSNSPQ